MRLNSNEIKFLGEAIKAKVISENVNILESYDLGQILNLDNTYVIRKFLSEATSVDSKERKHQLFQFAQKIRQNHNKNKQDTVNEIKKKLGNSSKAKKLEKYVSKKMDAIDKKLGQYIKQISNEKSHLVSLAKKITAAFKASVNEKISVMKKFYQNSPRLQKFVRNLAGTKDLLFIALNISVVTMVIYGGVKFGTAAIHMVGRIIRMLTGHANISHSQAKAAVTAAKKIHVKAKKEAKKSKKKK